MSEVQIALTGLGKLEAASLVEHQQDFGGAELETKRADESSFGVLDPATAVVLTLGTIAVKGLVAWLLKTRDDELIEEQVEIRHPDGRVEIRTIRIQRTSESTDEQVAAVAEALG